MTRSLAPVALAALVASSVGCGGPAFDPLIGTWSRSLPADANFSSATQTVVFGSGGSVTLSSKRIYTSSAATLAGCTETSTTNAGTYTTTNSGGKTSLTTSGITTFTIVRAGCATAADNGTSTQTQANGSDTSGYAISGTTLTLTQMVSGMAVTSTFTRG